LRQLIDFSGSQECDVQEDFTEIEERNEHQDQPSGLIRSIMPPNVPQVFIGEYDGFEKQSDDKQENPDQNRHPRTTTEGGDKESECDHAQTEKKKGYEKDRKIRILEGEESKRKTTQAGDQGANDYKPCVGDETT
jgi:hypothetical protein